MCSLHELTLLLSCHGRNYTFNVMLNKHLCLIHCTCLDNEQMPEFNFTKHLNVARAKVK